jgi:hypothetical protein
MNKIPLTEFATAAHPLRCSSLPKLMQCNWRAVMLFNQECEDSSGAKADTGSAVHKAAESWHAQGLTVAGAIKEMGANLPRYPLADLADAEAQFLAYALDPRNQSAKIVVCEKQIAFTLPPSPADPTGQGIHVIGTLDQIREESDGTLKLHDIKTSAWPGYQILCEHAYQIAAYCIGASDLLGRPVHPGSVIMTRGYLKKGVDPRKEPGGIFWRYAWDLDRCRTLIAGVADIVALIRGGTVWAAPGGYCQWCPMKGPEFCLDHLHELTLIER